MELGLWIEWDTIEVDVINGDLYVDLSPDEMAKTLSNLANVAQST